MILHYGPDILHYIQSMYRPEEEVDEEELPPLID
jgi:hypothetical protein